MGKISYEGLATAQCYFQRADPEHIRATSELLRFCDSLGQLWRFVDGGGHCFGYIAWLRFGYPNLPMVKQGGEAFRRWATQVPVAELRSGPVLHITETLTIVPGFSARAGRALSRLPGVERVTAHIRGRWRERKVVRNV